MTDDSGWGNLAYGALGVALLPVFGTIMVTDALRDHDAARKKNSLKATKTLWHELNQKISSVEYVNLSEIHHYPIEYSLDHVHDDPPTYSCALALVTFASDLAEFDGLTGALDIDWENFNKYGVTEGVRIRNYLRMQKRIFDDFKHTHKLWELTVIDLLIPILETLPDYLFRPNKGQKEEKASFEVPVISLIKNVPELLDRYIIVLFRQKLREAGLFTAIRTQIEDNMRLDSRTPLPLPSENKNQDPVQLAYIYFHDTPFQLLFETSLPFVIPEQKRFEHQWFVAGSGHGKTQTLQSLILDDLDKVADGEATVIVIDSQGDLINNIKRLKRFAEGEPLDGKLCLIDPTDVEYPVCLNLFDVGMERIREYNMLDRERLINGILELYDFVLGSLLSAELTQKQSLVFRYITRLMLHIPDATIHTLREVMEEGGHEKYEEYIKELKGTARAFFETEFNHRQFQDTKRQVVRRLWGVLENQTFERMFSHPRNKVDMFFEMNEGKVILINTAKELLKQNGTEIFGRFFIAMIAQAALERATLTSKERMPTYVYIDECQDYVDRNVALILEQARKYNVGMILSHQYVGQLPQQVLGSFEANTSIKGAGGVSSRDARTFSHMLRCDPSFIENQPTGFFATHIRGFTETAISLRTEFGRLENEPRMTKDELIKLNTAIRERYATHYSEVEQTISETLPDETKDDYQDPDQHDTTPSSWG